MKPATRAVSALRQRLSAFGRGKDMAHLEGGQTLGDQPPLAIAGFELLERTGQVDRAREQLLRILEQDTEDTTAFRATSRYIVATATRT